MVSNQSGQTALLIAFTRNIGLYLFAAHPLDDDRTELATLVEDLIPGTEENVPLVRDSLSIDDIAGITEGANAHERTAVPLPTAPGKLIRTLLRRRC